MLKNSLKKVIVCVFSIAALVMVMRVSFAADILSQLNSIGNENVQQIPEGVNNSVTEQPVQNIPTTNNTTNNTNENLPKTTPYTGIADNFSFVFVIIFAISAIYAYKKVKEYND